MNKAKRFIYARCVCAIFILLHHVRLHRLIAEIPLYAHFLLQTQSTHHTIHSWQRWAKTVPIWIESVHVASIESGYLKWSNLQHYKISREELFENKKLFPFKSIFEWRQAIRFIRNENCFWFEHRFFSFLWEKNNRRQRTWKKSVSKKRRVDDTRSFKAQSFQLH